MLYYFVLLIIDTVILQVLVFLNPNYGMNSPDEVYNIMDIVEEAHELLPKIKEHTNQMQSMSYKDYLNAYEEVDSKLKEFNLRYYELLVQLHTNMFSIILNG
jgi:hypothetical protein